RAGGIRGSIFIGGVQQINSLREQNLALDFFLTISFGIMGLYHISLYISRRKDPSSIFFSFLCFAIILRTISTSENILMYIFPDLTFQVVLKIRFISVIITIPSFLYFVKALFPDFSKSLPAYLSLIFTGVFSLIVIVMDSMFNIRYIQPLLSILLFITIMYIFYILVVSSINKEEGALNFLIGYIVLLITVLNDLLVTNEIILSKKNIYLAQYGIFIFIFSQVYVLSRRYSKAFTNVETLSDELEEKNQELLRLNQLKDDFLANTSHELRTPLNGIIGLADSMLKGIGGPYDKKAILNLSMISSSGRRLSHLVNDILDFSKMKNQDIVLKKVPVDLSSLVELVFEISKSLIGNKKIVLENRCLNFPPLLADENRLQQILYNLIGNAIKFTEEGTVIVSSDENNINNNEMIISVCDTGIGIPKDKHELIFETFQQAEGSISRKYGGTGLGLSITKKLIELHGGSIRVESPPVSDEFKNKFGTCFIFSIPIYQKDENVEEVKFENNKEPQITQYYIKENEFIQYSNISDLKNEIPKKSKYHVLAVDDDMVNLQVIENHLSIKNYSVTKASSGTNALQLLGSGESFDLVLLDLMMPGLNGFEVCNTIRRKFKKNELPIIILTAKNNVSDLEESLRVGGNDYLTKPFSFGELISRSENQLKMLEYFREVQELNKNLENKVTERTKELEDSKELLQKEKDILAKIVITDGLTGIHNRSYILNQLIEEYNQFKNNEKTFSTILLDIDNFKKINDTYGHQVGDIV
ncbi:MAG: response regulator, partial [Leptospiraceae bacterium]|nr:response regulator [Leptospiraceae bacterium]